MATNGNISRTSGLAVASLVLGILSWIPIFPLMLGSLELTIFFVTICAILAVIFGHVSRKEIRRSAAELRGRGMALTGLILGYAKILMVLLSLVSAIGISSRKQIYSTAAENQIAAYNKALQIYCLENGIYPTTDQGLQALVAAPTSEPVPTKWHGPYLDPAVIKPDPWNRPYIYVCPPRQNPDPKGFDLYSAGPDGRPNTGDDVVSWR